MNAEKQRLENKLALWDTPGFSQFIEDLADSIGPLTNIRNQVEVLRRIYVSKLVDLRPKSKFKQSKLDI